MFQDKSPSYLREQQPNNAMLCCQDLIQQISVDHSTEGIPGDLCMQKIVQQYKKMLSKRFKHDQRQERSDTNKAIKE